MADQGIKQAPGSGPGNKVIATTLLESLAARGEMAAHARAIRSLGLADGELANATSWLPENALEGMLAAGEVDSSLARSVGHRLISPDVTGIALYGLGLATPEKAYRRVQSLFPRERAKSAWSVEEIESGSARLCFRESADNDGAGSADRSVGGSDRGRAALCALRAGMLEAVPCLYGLLPARVVETTCRAKGGDACRYEVSWQRSSRTGLIIGSVLGLGVAVANLWTLVLLGPSIVPIAASGFAALATFVFGASIGRCVDLHRQLEAVAGARRGHLALFDQVDDALASKLDALARADAKLEGDEFAHHPARTRLEHSDASTEASHDRRQLLCVVERIHATAGDLECWFEESAVSEGRQRLDVPRARLREIRDSAEQLVETLAPDGEQSRKAVDVASLLARAIATTRPSLPASTVIEFDRGEDPLLIECEPVQIEQVVIQLLRNAATASHRLSESPLVKVSLVRVARGIEIAIEDRGVGLDPGEIDEVFDPFFAERRAGIDEGFGLPICLRIVERHGGELRIEVEDRSGTRVSVFLPESQPSR